MKSGAVVLTLLVCLVGLAPAADRATAVAQEKFGGKLPPAQTDASGPQIATPDLAGGPDGFGYSFKDETEAGGPVYSWIDTVGATLTGITGDDNYGTIALPFTFTFYGTPYSYIYPCTNGWASFSAGGYAYSNATLPSASIPVASICPYWDDLSVNGGTSNIWYKTTGSAPNRKFAVIWQNVPTLGGSLYMDFEIVLDEATGSVTLQYADLSTMTGSSATVGQQGAQSGLNFLQYSYNSGTLINGRAIKFYLPPPVANDVGVANLLAPLGAIGAGTVVTPACSVANFGTASQSSYAVRMKVGGFYNQTATVTSHAPGTKQYVTFPTFVMPDTGSYAVSCSTELSGDANNSNDKRTGVTTATPPGAYKVLMVAAEPMTSYPYLQQALMDSAYGRYVAVDWFDPRSQYLRRPDSLIAEGYKAILTFTDYTYFNAVGMGDTLAKFQELGGGVVVQVFADAPSWGMQGRYVNQYLPVVQVGTTYGSRMMGTIYSPGHPVMAGVTTITSGMYNTASTAIAHPSYTTRLSDWSVGGLVQAAAYDSANLRNVFLGFFPVQEIGNYMSGQWVRQISNALRWVVPTRNIGAVAIVAPVDTIVAGPVTPQATVHNYGDLREPCSVIFTVNPGAVYTQTVNLPLGLPTGVDTTISFPDWNATLGSFTAVCSTYYATDPIHSNDVVSAPFVVAGTPAVVDVGVSAITAPTGLIDTGATVTPAATVNNYGDNPATFKAYFSIFDGTDALVYAESVDIVGLANGASTSAVFPEFAKPHLVGDYVTRCSTYIAGDGNAANDARGGSFEFIAAPPMVGWHEIAQVPMAPSGKAVKDGGAICYDNGQEAFFVLKGYKAGDFYAYDRVGSAWTDLAAMPLGIENKPPYKGTNICSDGNGTFYATKGNNTTGFYKYAVDTTGGAWTQLADVPLGLSNKKVKGGTDMVYVEDDTVGYVYLLKGYKCEFYRYNVAAGTWETLAEAPIGVKNKYDKGSWLAYDEAGRKLYAHKAKYMEMYAYDLDSMAWGSLLTGMPLANGQTGKSKKAKDGSDGVVLNGKIYSLKGGNTIDFYTYDLTTAAWAEKETIPSVGSTLKKKRVKGGGSMATDGVYVVALKGNKTAEVWLYGDPAPVFATAPQHSGVMAGKTATSAGFSLGPNPLATGAVTLRYSLPVSGPASVSVVDVTGRKVSGRSLTLGRAGTVSLDLRDLAAGVYLVKLQSGNFTGSQKLVVER
jgi:hypothetical protein